MTEISTRVITPVAILSFPHLFEPSAIDENSEPKYSASFLFDADTDISQLKKVANDAGRAKWGDKYEEMVRMGQIRSPFRIDGESKGYPEGTTFIGARSKKKPGIVLPWIDKATGKPAQLTDEEKIYPGCKVRASLTAFGYDRAGNKGVSFALNNLQWVEDGERLDSSVAATEEFDAVSEAPAPASIDDLL